MDLLESRRDSSVIALWLGHESVETTQIYSLPASKLKERRSPKRGHGPRDLLRFPPDDKLLAFLQSL